MGYGLGIYGADESAREPIWHVCGWEWCDFGRALGGLAEQGGSDEWGSISATVSVSKLEPFLRAARIAADRPVLSQLCEMYDSLGWDDPDVDAFFYEDILGNIPDSAYELEGELGRYNAITDPLIAEAIRKADLERAQAIRDGAAQIRMASQRWIASICEPIDEAFGCSVCDDYREMLMRDPGAMVALLRYLPDAIDRFAGENGSDAEVRIVAG